MRKKVWLIPTANSKYIICDNININNVDCIAVRKNAKEKSLSECLKECQDNNWYMLTIDIN